MPLRISLLTVFSVLVLSACAQMDDSVETEQVVSAVVLEETTGQEFVIELAYTDAVTYEEAVVLVNNIDVTHESGISLADDVPASVLANATGIFYELPTLSDLSHHVFQVTVHSDLIDLSQLIDEYRWEWIETDLPAFLKHCPPGHGG